MCGRFTQQQTPKVLREKFGVDAPEAGPRFNVAPTQDVLAVRGAPGGREAALLQWGLIPAWAKDPAIGNKLINARSETVTEKPSFREAFRLRRCLIPADGFYEWQRRGGRKQPYYFQLKDGGPFAFAGLWERWQGAGGRPVETCTILTTEANELLRTVHDRMPVILHPEEYPLWLGADARERGLLRDMLRPYPAEEMVGYPVSTQVNSPQSQGPELVRRQGADSA